MEILQLLLSNFGMVLLTLIWVIYGLVALVRKETDMLMPFVLTILYGIYRFVT